MPMHLSRCPYRRSVAALVLAATLPAQHAWVTLNEVGATGVVVADSPLQPWLLAMWPPPFFAASAVHQFAAGRFHRRADALVPQLGQAQAAVYDAVRQRLVVYCSSPGGPAVCVFDGARWTALATSNPPPLRLAPAMAFEPVAGRIVLFGGVAPGSFGIVFGDTWALDGDAWTLLHPAGPGAPPPRRGAGLAAVPAAAGPQLVLFGGNGQFGGSALHYGDTWTWDGTTWTEHVPGATPTPRERPQLASDPATGHALLYGGLELSPTLLALVPLGDAWRWDGTGWSLLPPPSSSPLSQPALARDGGRLLLFGRQGGARANVQVHAWQNGWSPVYQDPPLPDVVAPALAVDLGRHEVLRFGGREQGTMAYRDDTWVFDGRWLHRTPAVAPSARSEAACAFAPVPGHVVLFGGVDGGALHGDTWVWDGVDWQQRLPLASPGPRYRATACWHPGFGGVVLFGGLDATTVHRDTWLWNGVDWVPLPSATLPSPQPGRLAFDETRQVLALAQPGQLWEWQPAGWSLVDSTTPTGQLVFDPATGALAVYGATIWDRTATGWTPRSQPGSGLVVTDLARGGVLAIDATVVQSTPQPATLATYGSGCGPLGEVTLAFDRRPALGTGVQAQVRALAPATLVALAIGATPANVPLGGGCSAHVDQLFQVELAVAGPGGWADLPLFVPPVPALAGAAAAAQAMALLPGGLGLSNGVRVVLGQ